MDFSLHAGLKGSKNFVVTSDSTAIKYGSGLVEVFATPAMVALMETTALESVEAMLQEGYTTVGTEICIKHLRASSVGTGLFCESRLTEINGRKLVFEVSVWDDVILVGHGMHTRFVVEKNNFIEKLKTR